MLSFVLSHLGDCLIFSHDFSRVLQFLIWLSIIVDCILRRSNLSWRLISAGFIRLIAQTMQLKTSVSSYSCNRVFTNCNKYLAFIVLFQPLLPYVGSIDLFWYHHVMVCTAYSGYHCSITSLSPWLIIVSSRLTSCLLLSNLLAVTSLLCCISPSQANIISFWQITTWRWLLSNYLSTIITNDSFNGSYGSYTMDLVFYYHFECRNLASLLPLFVMEHSYLSPTYNCNLVIFPL